MLGVESKGEESTADGVEVTTRPHSPIVRDQSRASAEGLIACRRGTGARMRKRPADAIGLLAVLGIVASALLLVVASFSIALNSQTGEDVKRARANYTTHDAIMIMGNTGFTPVNGVTDGTGTALDPYIIENWEIDATVDMFGVYIYGTTAHYIVRSVHVYGSGTMGVVLYSAPHGVVEGCLVDSGMAGMVLMETDDCNLTGNTVTDQDLIGIELYTCQQIDIFGNTLLNNNMSSIAGIDSTNIVVSSNTCSDSNWSGVMAEMSGSWEIRDNNVSGNGFFGITMNDTWSMTVRDNEVTSNAEYGIYVGNSTDVSVYHNVFVGNGVQALEDTCVNAVWDDGYPSGGNYWSDYAGSDNNNGVDQDVPGADGIGDTPYSFDFGGADRYPWMTPDMVVIPEFGTAVLPILCVFIVVVVVSHFRRRKPHT